MMDDLISRQEAIDGINNICPVDTEYDCTLLDRVDVRCVLSDLPSAQPDRKKGNWVYGEDEYGIDGYHCDKCGFFVPWDYTHKFISYIEDYNFCPSCGADMRGSNNEYEKIIGV